MSPSAPVVRNVFRACVVTAVRESEALMVQLIEATRTALTSEEAQTRNVVQRDTASDALRLLGQHEAALVKAYPMALLEIFAEGPAGAKTRTADPTGMDFGELSLVDDAQVQAQVELSRAQQQALHTTDATLSELNGLVSAAQGLHRVQPERNPLRPENYIRALQQVVAETGVPAPVREAWMQNMRALLGHELVAVYQRAAQSLREHGIAPVGYGVAALPGAGTRSAGPASHGGTYSDSLHVGQGAGYGTGYGAPHAYGHTGMAPGWEGGPGRDIGVEEALLTVGILRQMLAGGGDPYDAVRSVQAGHGQQPAGPRSVWAAPHGSVVSAHAGLASSHYPVVAAEALHDIAQLERLVGRLAQSQPAQPSRSALLAAQRSTYSLAYGAPADPSDAGAEVVARMVENMAQDSRLLPPVQRAVQSLEPALCQLVRHDPRFFSDSNHPARRLLDELTQRSLAFTAADAPGFSRFMRLVNEVVEHLTGREITSAEPFEVVLKALQSAWEAQENKLQAQRQAQEQELLQAEQREMLAAKIAAGIRALPGVEHVPADLMDFAAGPWAQVVALAQVSEAASTSPDPGGYVALVPDFFWSVQPDLTSADMARLIAMIPALLETLRTGLQSIDYPQASSSAFFARLTGLHRRAIAAQKTLAAAQEHQTAAPDPEPAPGTPPQVPEPMAPALTIPALLAGPEAAPEPVPTEVGSPFVLGAWIELTTHQRKVRTQLTWASPHHTLFLFTAADGSTQSMTRRMRDKLTAEGALRVISAQPVVARAIDALGKKTKTGPSSASARRKPPPSDGD